jgi:hypothetical protein
MNLILFVLDQNSGIEHVRHGTRQINRTVDRTRANQGVSREA